jgi:transposase
MIASMPDAQVVRWISQKYTAIEADLDERARRRWAAAEARSLGWGGTAAVAKATGISDRTIRRGILELDDPHAASTHRQRQPGAGRKSREAEQPKLKESLERLVASGTRGDPMSPLRWTCKSTKTLAAELQRQGFQVSSVKVGQLLKEAGYSLQANRKTIEGKQHPDRNAQFEFIAKRIRTLQKIQQPTISVDTKKKEVLGNLKNSGKTYRRQKDPIQVETHDFPKKELGKAVPYGVYDIGRNEAGVTIGISSDTAEFAVAAIHRWWKRLGSKRYPKAKRVLITADSGGSNSPRTRLWRTELQKLSNATGLIIEVCHYPPGTSKWNKIEHKLFCHITRNWQGVPLETLEVVVSLIGNTRTASGLEVHAWIDGKTYEKARSVTDEELAEVIIRRHKFHGEWNYEIHPAE